MRSALLQMTASDDPIANLAETARRIEEAAREGAGFVLTPEVTNCLSFSRTHRQKVLQPEDQDRTLAGLRNLAAKHSLWISVGSLALKTDDPEGRLANRGFILTPTGDIAARYDKIHMFDVQVSETETYRESAGFRPGERAVTVDTPFGRLGMAICYDLRFPHLFRALAQAGADVLLIPAAFSPVTGAAHWEPLLRARAIENTAYVLAAAQTGIHTASRGKARTTYGHSMAIAPWGEVLATAGTDPTTLYVDLNSAAVKKARNRVPSLTHDRPFEGP